MITPEHGNDEKHRHVEPESNDFEGERQSDEGAE